MAAGQSHIQALTDATRELDIGVDGGQQHSLDPGKLVSLSRWIVAVAVVDFDIDNGPCIKELYPPVALDPTLQQNIAFSAFPDATASQSFTEAHSFRLKYLQSPAPDQTWLHAFAHFEQHKDETIKRGYFQRAVVILTHLPYPSLFTLLVSELAPMYFQHGIPMLETACHNIANWPAPKPGSRRELGILGTVFIVAVPKNLDDQQFIATTFGSNFDASQHLLASIPKLVNADDTATSPRQPEYPVPQPPTLLALCRSILPSMWSIWECLVLGEPLLVFAPTPSMTSNLIWWFRDLVRPLPLTMDFRPYYTIQDLDFKEIFPRGKAKAGTHMAPPKSGLVLGVTNPYFESACAHWPHTISLAPLPRMERSLTRSSSMSSGKLASSSAGGSVRSTKTKTRSLLNFSRENASTPSLSQAAPSGPTPGWHTKTHSRYISKDRPLLARLEEALSRGGSAEVEASWALRQHFSERATALLQPLNRYLASLIPRAGGKMGRFNDAQFFASLDTHGAALPFRSASKRRTFYERFLRTPTFGVWLAEAEARVVVHVQQTQQHQTT